MKPILIVEDEAIMRESLRDWLTDSGYEVETAEEGEEALRTVSEQDFGLLILDLKLPGSGGIEIFRRARTKRPQLKGIIITAYPSVETAVEAMKEGAVDYFPKPFDLDRLGKVVRETLGPLELKPKPEVVTDPLAPEEIPMHIRRINDKSALIQMLLDIQRENRWLSREALVGVSEKLDLPLSQIYHVCTFYKAFSLVPQGRHSISVCVGTACHVRGAPRLLDNVTRTLGVKPGETTKDMQFTLNTVNCLGCCALGPVMVIDDEYYGSPWTAGKVEKIFAEY